MVFLVERRGGGGEGQKRPEIRKDTFHISHLSRRKQKPWIWNRRCLTAKPTKKKSQTVSKC